MGNTQSPLVAYGTSIEQALDNLQYLLLYEHNARIYKCINNHLHYYVYNGLGNKRDIKWNSKYINKKARIYKVWIQ